MMSEIPNIIDLIWRAAASFSGGLCYLVVRRDLPPRKAVGVIVIAIAFGLFVADEPTVVRGQHLAAWRVRESVSSTIAGGRRM